MKITLQKAQKDHERLLVSAKCSLGNKNYDDTLALVACAANHAYHLNYIYSDMELENILKDVAFQVLGTFEKKPSKNYYLFYDDFGYDNRGLTQQYLHALDSMDVSYLYLVDSDGFNENGGIASQIAQNPSATIKIIPRGLSPVEKLKYLYDVVAVFNPEKAFLHLNPWSSVAVSLWSSFPLVQRYLIDLTDHAFWLGLACCDYFIGFRDYGYNISIKERGIANDKLLTLPYYPIISQAKFLGFPDEVKGRTIIFSGATYYKVYGENDAFFKIIKRIVADNPKVAIVFAGSGDIKPFEKFIRQNKLNKNVYLIGSRPDINEVFLNCDIYLNTYPIMGALMSQYAVFNKKPLIGYTNIDVPCNESEGMFMKSLNYKCTYHDLDEFHNAINQLIASEHERLKASDYPDGILATPESFAKDFSELISCNKAVVHKSIAIDVKKFCDIYLSMENNYLHKYEAIKFRHLGVKSFKFFPVRSVISFINVIFYNYTYLMSYVKGMR